MVFWLGYSTVLKSGKTEDDGKREGPAGKEEGWALDEIVDDEEARLFMIIEWKSHRNAPAPNGSSLSSDISEKTKFPSAIK